METNGLRLRSIYGEVITCSVKEVTKNEYGTTIYEMDNKKCNDFHNSSYNGDASDCRVRSVRIFESGNYHVYASYKKYTGNYRRGAQAIDATLINN